MKSIKIDNVEIGEYIVEVSLSDGAKAIFPRTLLKKDQSIFTSGWNETVSNLQHVILNFDQYKSNKLLKILFGKSS